MNVSILYNLIYFMIGTILEFEFMCEFFKKQKKRNNMLRPKTDYDKSRFVSTKYKMKLINLMMMFTSF